MAPTLSTAIFAALSTVACGNALADGASFDEYLRAFGRAYHKGSDEYAMRHALYQQRVMDVQRQNTKPDRLWNAGLNGLTDRTNDELKQLRGWRHKGLHEGRPSLLAESSQKKVRTSLPETIDWRKNATIMVRDQGACGSCWAVATSAMLETHYQIHMNEMRSFATQELVSCVPNPHQCGGTGGCSGATVELAMKYVEQNGLGTEQQVPYNAVTGTCASSLLSGGDAGKSRTGLAGLKSWETLPSNKAQPLMAALQRGPVAISAAASEWSMYMDGVFDGCQKDAIIDHAIVMVGYGHDAGVKKNYWTVLNSWGKGWGEGGYIRVLRGDTAEDDNNHCGTDYKPGDGIACKPYPEKVEVCGMCGLLYDSVSPTFDAASAKMVQKAASNTFLSVHRMAAL